ncbi:MAG: hypothetical protein IAG13_34170 [Deltaproteobacteria bacterium]|nr:hypothetical protein [Nannocystaceae bacterium]
MNDAMHPAMEQMFLQMMARRSGTPIEELRAASRQGPAMLAAKLGVPLPPEILDAPVVREDDELEPGPDPEPQPMQFAHGTAIDREMRRVAARLRDLEDAHRSTLAVLQRVADTLGACPACFGYYRDCDICFGEGKPGHFESSHPRTLRTWLTPFVRRTPPPAQPARSSE